MIPDHIPTRFFDILPVPILVTKLHPNEELERIVYVNKSFIRELGWTLEDIPTKATWWRTAYPDVDYQKVIARQWELQVAHAKEVEDSFVTMQANVETKHAGQKRFEIYTQIDADMISDHWVIVFEPLPATTLD